MILIFFSKIVLDKTDANIQNIKRTIQNDSKDGDWAYIPFKKKVI